jgi:hypothetical protein
MRTQQRAIVAKPEFIGFAARKAKLWRRGACGNLLCVETFSKGGDATSNEAGPLDARLDERGK